MIVLLSDDEVGASIIRHPHPFLLSSYYYCFILVCKLQYTSLLLTVRGAFRNTLSLFGGEEQQEKQEEWRNRCRRWRHGHEGSWKRPQQEEQWPLQRTGETAERAERGTARE